MRGDFQGEVTNGVRREVEVIVVEKDEVWL